MFRIPSPCRRDLEQQIKSERIRQALQRDDRVEARQRMAAATIRAQSTSQHTSAQQQLDSRAPQQQQPSAQHENHILQQQQQQQQYGEGQSDDEGELQRLRQQRLRQLQAESAVKQEQQREGFGVLNTVPESSVLVSCKHPCIYPVFDLCWMKRGSAFKLAGAVGDYLTTRLPAHNFQHGVCPLRQQQQAKGLCLACNQC